MNFALMPHVYPETTTYLFFLFYITWLLKNATTDKIKVYLFWVGRAILLLNNARGQLRFALASAK